MGVGIEATAAGAAAGGVGIEATAAGGGGWNRSYSSRSSSRGGGIEATAAGAAAEGLE